MPRISLRLFLAASLLHGIALAQPGSSPKQPGSQDLAGQLDEVLKSAPTPAQPPPAQPPAQQGASGAQDLAGQLEEVLRSAPSAPTAPAQQAAGGGRGLLNPDISVIFDGVAGAASQPLTVQSADDPNFDGLPGRRTGGFTLQELELGFQSTVDPYFDANVFLTIPNLEALEVEEAYAISTSLPAGFQIKAGVFRSAAGRQNEQHLHVQDFSRRPLLNAAYLGSDGLRPPGAQLSWLAPTPFFLRFLGEISSVAPGSSPTFGGSLRSSPTLLGNVKTFVPLTRSWSVLLGGTFAEGHAPPPGFNGSTPLEINGPHTLLGGVDLYLKYMPPNHAKNYFSFALQSEYFLRRTAAFEGGASSAQVDAGFYAQLVAQLTRRWHAGVRWDRLGMPASEIQPRIDQLTAMIAFTPSEFSRVRFQAERERPASGSTIFEMLLLLEYSIGAHGAHPF